MISGTNSPSSTHAWQQPASWPAALFPYAGIWITRGFWNGLHHWAIEPTNAPVDRLNETAGSADPALCMLDPRETRRWSLAVGLSRV